MQTGTTTTVTPMEAEEIEQMVELANQLPRDYRLIIYGQMIAHKTMIDSITAAAAETKGKEKGA